MPEVFEVAGRLVEVSEELVEWVLCQGLHAGRDYDSQERCVAMRVIYSYSSGLNQELTDGSTNCPPIRATKLSGWPT